MKKKLLSVLLSTAMVASLLVGCGSTAEEPATEPAVEEEATEEAATEEPAEEEAEEAEPETTEATEAATMEAPSTDGWDDSMKIYAYSWNDEFGSRLQYVLDAYPEYADYVEYINLGVSGTDGTYQTAIDTAMEAGDKYPSLFAADNDVAKYYTESDMTMVLADAGITNDMYANAYQYTVDYATYDGNLKALTWQAAPGNFTYRADIAEEVLGTSEPAEVQEYVKDWDTFFETAQTMKDAGYAMISGPDDIKYAVWDQQTQPWVTVADDGSETLTLDSAVTDYLEMAKKLYDEGYTANTSMWSDAWSANFEGDVFGYFGCTWFVYWCIATTEDSETSTFGQWRVCEGPVSYHWGGTYVMIGADTPNPDLAAFLLYELCADPEIMYTIEEETMDFVNNKEAVANIIADGKGASDILGGQNPVETWAEAALTIDLSNSTYLDSALKAIMDTASQGYNAGTYETVDDAVQFIKDEVAKNYDYITVE
ncbi:MAG: extracellular solute-binding protein [Lachnospiraceae bacterium]|nr:extracellular solute-binding protein [Lachnospiraceae bacterium]